MVFSTTSCTWTVWRTISSEWSVGAYFGSMSDSEVNLLARRAHLVDVGVVDLGTIRNYLLEPE
jgi:hypothetical protein